MKYSIKPLLKLAFFTSICGFLSSCSTYIHLGTTLYWSGKDVNEFMESKGLYPDDIKQCSSEKETFLIYGFARPLYNVLEYGWDAAIMLMAQPFIPKKKKPLQATINGPMSLPI